MYFVGMSNVGGKIDVNAASIGNIQNGDVNGDGIVSLSDAFCVLDYIKGIRNIPNLEVADFNNDGFISNADARSIENYGIHIKDPINSNYTPSKSTSLLNTDVDYYRYNATTGKKIGEAYTVKAAKDIKSKDNGLIGNDERVKDYSHSAICRIKTSNSTNGATGFVVSNNCILTAAHVVRGQKIESITFYDKDGNETLNANAIDYSVPTNFIPRVTDYALITVSDDLSSYNNLDIGYALQYALDTQADVYVTGYQPLYQQNDEKNKDKYNPYEMRTGKGRLDTNNTTRSTLHYTCDILPGASGGPIYADLIFGENHYYTVVGIQTNFYVDTNCGVRMCPNITNLIQFNSK